MRGAAYRGIYDVWVLPSIVAMRYSLGGRGGLMMTVARMVAMVALCGVARADVVENVQLILQQGGVLGAGMLARYPSPGPGSVTVSRTTTAVSGEPYAPICTARVLDPTGATVACYEFSDQANGLLREVLTVPSGPAGIYQISVSGGRNGDQITFDLPQPTTWGIRGEMALGPTSGAWSGTWWMWVPSTCTTLIALPIDGCPAPGIATAGGTALNWSAGANNTLVLAAPPVSTTLKVTLAPITLQGVAFDGVPGLLCPTQAYAIDLAGGSIMTPDGFMVGGPLQARVQAWMIQAAVGNLTPSLTFPTSVSPTVAMPLQQAQLYGQYAPLSSLASELPIQNLNVTDPQLGVFLPAGTVTVDWRTFLHGEDVGFFSPSGLAAAVSCNCSLNPAYGNSALLHRATLAAFHHLVEMQGDGLLRDDDFRINGSPMTYSFFSYPYSLAQPLVAMYSQLDTVAQGIWHDGLIAVGDKIGNYQGSESNQMAAIMMGHLQTYLATGQTQTRFLGYFERMATAYCTGAFGPAAKFGQHPAGYYLENYGPDGNYDSINGTVMAIAYNAYSALAAAKPAVVATLSAAMTRNQTFKSYHWLPQPDGSFLCATAFNCRQDTTLCNGNWPAEAMAYANFPLAQRRWQGNLEQLHAYPGTVMPALINSNAWAIAALQNQVPNGDTSITATDVQAPWTLGQWAESALPVTVSPAGLPYESAGIYQVPGQVSWKLGGLYGNVFYDVLGANQVLTGLLGGGPTELWTSATGMVEGSMRNANQGVITSAATLTHACVAGSLNSALFWTGSERSTLSWVVPNQHFTITGNTQQATGTIVWDYQLANDAVQITATLTVPGVTGAYMNLPVPLEASPSVAIAGSGATITVGTATVQIASATTPVLASSLNAVPNAVTCIQVPLSGTTSLSASVILSVAPVPTPAAPTIVITGSSSATVSGTGVPGLIVNILLNGVAIGQTTVTSGGTWSFVTALPTVPLALTVYNSDALGRTGPQSTGVVLGAGGGASASAPSSGGGGGGGCGLGAGATLVLCFLAVTMRARLWRRHSR